LIPTSVPAPPSSVSVPAPPSSVSLPAPPDRELFRALPVRVSPRAPPMTFSMVAPEERVRVSPALTACADGLPRLTATARVVVAEKSRVSTPPPDSLIVSLPRAVSVSKRKVSVTDVCRHDRSRAPSHTRRDGDRDRGRKAGGQQGANLQRFQGQPAPRPSGPRRSTPGTSAAFTQHFR
jgi:hypothetical protein